MTLRERLRSTDPMLFALVNVPDPALVEVAAHAGFDAAIVDAEHGPIGIREVQELVRAGDAASIATIVRVPVATKEWVLRSLDAGAAGILAPQIDSAADAADVVAEASYPPEGRRGAGFYARQYRYSVDRGAEAIAAARRDTVVGAQIESVAAVGVADQILATAGVDFVFVGPTDLSVDHGSIDTQHPWVVEAISGLAVAGREANVPMAIYAANAEAALSYRRMGFGIVAVGLLPILTTALSSYVSEIRAGEVGSPRARPR